MISIIFYHHPAPSVADSAKYQKLHLKVGPHWRGVVARVEAFDGDVEAALKHAASVKLENEVVLNATTYEP